MNKTVLIVEDEFIVAQDISLTLQNGGYTVCGIADNVEEAEELIERKKPSLVLLDIRLKGKKTGIDLAIELKEKNIAFVYLSANSNQTTLEAAKATEPYGFLVKPFREKDLLVMLDIAFYRHENSLESQWRKELSFQKALLDIQSTTITAQQKLLELAKALQQFIPFDFISIKCGINGDKTYLWLSFLRVGLDEYQAIGLKELSVISGNTEDELCQMVSSSPQDLMPSFFDENKFQRYIQSQQLNQLLSELFQLHSTMVLPLLNKDSHKIIFNFFSKKNDTYSVDIVNWISRLQMPLLNVLNNLPLINITKSPLNNSIVGNQKDRRSKFKNIIGNCTSLLKVLDLVAQVANVETSVLLLGESGTGKEKIASCIHELSSRKNKPFIKINCATLPPTLIESELFGHEKGAFTNALEKRTGKFELADTGTIFLDEIGDMPLELQVKLLRVLQEKEIERIGGKHPVKIDVRFIAATNRNLQVEMAAGRFRLDLYYRLNAFPITLPPLRERKEDIRALSEYFAHCFADRFNKSYSGISDNMLQQLCAYDFPGNIRELENIIEQAVILNDGQSKLMLREELVTSNNNNYSFTPDAIKTIEEIKQLQRRTEIDYISSVLKKTRGRIRGKNGAAELLDEKPTTLESRMLKLGLRKEDFQ